MGSTVVGPYPQGNQATYQGPSAALVAVHKNADLVSQFSVHMQSIETAGIARQGQPTAMLAPKGRETPEGALQRARGPFPEETSTFCDAGRRRPTERPVSLPGACKTSRPLIPENTPTDDQFH